MKDMRVIIAIERASNGWIVDVFNDSSMRDRYIFEEKEDIMEFINNLTDWEVDSV